VAQRSADRGFGKPRDAAHDFVQVGDALDIARDEPKQNPVTGIAQPSEECVLIVGLGTQDLRFDFLVGDGCFELARALFRPIRVFLGERTREAAALKRERQRRFSGQWTNPSYNEQPFYGRTLLGYRVNVNRSAPFR